MLLRRLALVGCLVLLAPATAGATTKKHVKLHPYSLSKAALTQLQSDFVAQIRSKYSSGTWAPMKMTLNNRQLRLMGLPSAKVLRQGFKRPTLVNTRTGKRRALAGPTLATYAGAGWFGIRPGALLLTVTDEVIGWCSMAHVYGAAGSYKISTAGHCGNVGDKGTVVAAVGNRDEVVLLDFGRYSSSTGDAGVGKDWALISVDAPYQSLVTPTMAFWGGPRGVFTKTGAVAGYSFNNDNLLDPEVQVTPDPLLAQQIVHYGHGAGLGFPAGTPRSGTALSWGATNFMFFGAISPGDSGSGSNTLGGDTVGANMEAAGINTHIYVSPLMDEGLGILAGTRATAVGTPANGQIVPVPAPLPIVP